MSYSQHLVWLLLTSHFLAGCAHIGPIVKDGRSTATSVVFLIDADLTMRGNVADAANFVMGTVPALHPGQRFGVVFSCEKSPLILESRLLELNEQNKRRAIVFLEQNGGGTREADLDRAIDAAAAIQPNEIWIATAGRFRNGPAAYIAAQRAKQHGVRICAALHYASEVDDRSAVLKLTQLGGRDLR